MIRRGIQSRRSPRRSQTYVICVVARKLPTNIGKVSAQLAPESDMLYTNLYCNFIFTVIPELRASPIGRIMHTY